MCVHMPLFELNETPIDVLLHIQLINCFTGLYGLKLKKNVRHARKAVHLFSRGLYDHQGPRCLHIHTC